MEKWYGLSGVLEIPPKTHYDEYKIEYKGRMCFSSIVENTMYERFLEDYKEKHGCSFGDFNNEGSLFRAYIKAHADDVYELCDLALFPENHPELL